METNEIMTNEEVMGVVDATEEVVTENSGKLAKVCVGVGLAALVGCVVYKFVVKPIAKKIKAKKEEKEVTINPSEYDDAYDYDDGCEITDVEDDE